MSELKRSWPIIGIAFVMWLAVVVLRTPALGLDVTRVLSIIVSSTALITLGVYLERVRYSREREEEEGRK